MGRRRPRLLGPARSQRKGPALRHRGAHSPLTLVETATQRPSIWAFNMSSSLDGDDDVDGGDGDAAAVVEVPNDVEASLRLLQAAFPRTGACATLPRVLLLTQLYTLASHCVAWWGLEPPPSNS